MIMNTFVLTLLLLCQLCTAFNCYNVVSIIQEYDIHMVIETERRLHELCPSVSVHIVNGHNTSYDGVVETLLNRLDGSPPPCSYQSDEEKFLLKIGKNCSFF
jgi:hypothetical protein